ncbi:MerC domain-containing protein [Pelagicoccus sp. SDUM812002]|uniref:MerC domain-containing protein n=1 Tax=Pelagicoccus sp. SDUM812002 TaxID=3041266 RepID=UPI00280DF6B2|nr:MerC domain-containing protein [Pelagicoccus sp. SDUM812002]MDQ8184518.1 MerC domain-containing protein [Pelagicoccus sp. SDUM812002]
MQTVETRKWDVAGIGLSVLCAIHCLSVPFLMGVLPLVGLDFVADHGFEWVMMSLIFAVAGLSYFNGYRRHGRKAIFTFLAVGMIIFAGIRPVLEEGLHPVATILGGCVFVLGHWKNWHWHKPSCRKPCCSHD